MKHYIAFIQSISGKEWEVGEIINHAISYNPDYCDYYSEVYHIKTYEDLKNILYSIADQYHDCPVTIQIDAHANKEGLVFKDVKSPDKDICTDYVQWASLKDVLGKLFESCGTKITLIFVSCYSTILAEILDTPHIPLIVAEGEIAPRRAEEQLLCFYNKLCTGSNIQEAYDSMIQFFPINEETKQAKDNKSILKLYM